MRAKTIKRKTVAPYDLKREPEPESFPPCAVVDCASPGRSQVCPADGQYHSHGRIHYEHCHSDLTMRAGWHFICDDHYAVMCAARLAWVKAIDLARLQLATMLAATPCHCDDESTCSHEQIKIVRREIAALERT
jgi:hypothetical protein